jgi:hypothetical protein
LGYSAEEIQITLGREGSYNTAWETILGSSKLWSKWRWSYIKAVLRCLNQLFIIWKMRSRRSVSQVIPRGHLRQAEGFRKLSTFKRKFRKIS